MSIGSVARVVIVEVVLDLVSFEEVRKISQKIVFGTGTLRVNGVNNMYISGDKSVYPRFGEYFSV
jgi:hypothetical protein